MPDYTPIFLPGQAITLVAATPVTGGDPVEVAGSGQVQKAAAQSAKYVGVAAQDAVAGAQVTVFTQRVVHEGTADGPVTAGDQLVTSPEPGCQVTTLPASAVDVGAVFDETSMNAAINTALNLARSVIGVALTTAPNGTTVRWVQK